MPKGIVCKVWNIKGTTESKGAIDQLRDSVGYILNDEKTVGQGSLDPLNQLRRECKYIENDLKTFSGAFVGGHNITSTDVSDAVAEMMKIKRFYGKEDGRAALHMMISLPKEESDVSNASKLMQLCDSVVKEVFPNNQAVYAVHTNTDNLHIHIILNSVGLDGKKIHQNDRFMKDVLHPCVNKYASVYGFTQNPKWKAAPQSNLSFPQIKMALRTEIDRAIEKADNFEDFISALGDNGIKVRTGKYISLAMPDMSKPVRTHQLGSNYTKDAIIERILTRKEKLKLTEVGQHSLNNEIHDVYTPTILEMPKYKDMPKEQKKRVIHLLRLGLNPWRENRRMNWQLNRIADELNANDRIRSYMDFYSKDGTIESALSGMIDAKKQAAYEKKLILSAKRRYKPILDIYEEMKEIEKKSYLYEHKGVKEYRAEFEQYRTLTRRLKDGYNKEIFEVAAFLEECDERMLYAQAQISEISEEYRDLRKYAAKRGIVEPGKENNLIDMLGYYKDKENKNLGIATQDAFYISSPHSNIVIRVVKYPTMDRYGHLTESYDLTVTDRNGKEIEHIVSTDAERDFKKELDRLQSQYGLTDCKRFANINLAGEYCSSVPKNESVADKKRIHYEKTITFAQAVNHISDEKPIRVVISKDNPSFMALSSREEDKLKIVVFNSKGKSEESFLIPLVKKKNKEGYGTLVSIMNKYGFNDEVEEFDTLNDAKKYKDETDKETVRGRRL